MWWITVQSGHFSLTNPLADVDQVLASIAYNQAREDCNWKIKAGSIEEGKLVLQDGRKRSELITYTLEA